jgi:uncharacterized protein YbaR (Trm112 family)
MRCGILRETMVLSEGLVRLLACPCCKGEVSAVEGYLLCPTCSMKFPVSGGIPVLILDEAEKDD